MGQLVFLPGFEYLVGEMLRKLRLITCMFPYHGDAVMLAMNLQEPALWLRTLIYTDQIPWPVFPLCVRGCFIGFFDNNCNTSQKEKNKFGFSHLCLNCGSVT